MTPEHPMPQSFGRYQIKYRLAHGGMASVYLAQVQGPGGFEKWVALKTIHPHLNHDERFLRMFLDEARLSARLSHPNICAIHDFGQMGGTHFIAMEYLEGEPLRAVMSKAAAGVETPPELMARMVADAARGLHSAHEARDEMGKLLGVVHRDVSPQNIFVLYDGVAKVVDFGIARAKDRLAETTTGEVKGKMSYMAPEQLDTMTTDRRTDIFGLGVVLWEGTVLKRLFKRESTAMTVAAVLRDPIPLPSRVNPDYPPFLEQIVMKALSRDPDQRFQTMEQMADALDEFILSTHRAAGQAQVASWMRETFADRIQKRNALLTGSNADDKEEIIEVDISSTNSSVIATRASTPSVLTGRKAPEKKRSFILPLLVILVAVITGLGGWYLGASNRGDTLEGLAATTTDPPQPRDDDADAAVEPTKVEPAKVEPVPIDASTATDTSTATDAATTSDIAESSPPDTGAHDQSDAGSPSSPTKTVRNIKSGRVRPRPRPAAGSGFLNVISVPVAKVWLGGRSLGTTPLMKVRVPTGGHVLKLKAVRGDGASTRRVTIRPDEVTYISVRLEP